MKDTTVMNVQFVIGKHFNQNFSKISDKAFTHLADSIKDIPIVKYDGMDASVIGICKSAEYDGDEIKVNGTMLAKMYPEIREVEKDGDTITSFKLACMSLKGVGLSK